MTATMAAAKHRFASRPKVRGAKPSENVSSQDPGPRISLEDAAFERIVSRSPLMEEVFHRVRRVARVESTVLVTGESGTGKELIAESIHRSSARHDAPFVTINVAAVPEGLVESELFGHLKGAFTGSSTDRMGRFEAADGGTLFIDEIGDLQPTSQAKLLRVLENRVITRVGGNDDREVDVRVIAATNRPLEKMVSCGDFRDDLYYRLNIIRISVPPLRRREEDIALLVHHFIDEFCRRYKRPAVPVDAALMDYLQSHSWPGNVRELRNCVESMVVLSNSDRLTLSDLPATVRNSAPSAQDQFEIPENVTLAQMEKAAITQTLQRCDGNRTRAANMLEISVRTLQRKLARYDSGAA